MAPTTEPQQRLITRLRALLADEPVLREVAMFGGRSFMVAEKMVVSALKNGGLLVRVDGTRHAELLGRPGATQAEMGAGRTMGPGWIEVGAATLADDAALESWLALALEHRAATR